MKCLRFAVISIIIFFSLALAKPAYSAPLSIVVASDRQAAPTGAVYNVGETVTVTGSVSNGTAVPDALVLFEMDTPTHKPWIIRTLTTGQTPSPPLGQWRVELLALTPTGDGYGTPKYSFRPGDQAGFNVTLRNNSLNPLRVVVTINLFFSNGLPFDVDYMKLVNTTLDAGQLYSTLAWSFPIPANSVTGKAMVYASVFDKYPKDGGIPYSPEQSAAFNITSGVPAQAPPNSPPGTFQLSASLMSLSGALMQLGNYTVFAAATQTGYSWVSNQTTFTLKLFGDLNGDGYIDMMDIAIVAAAFDAEPGAPRWNAAADMTGLVPLMPDGLVDMMDIALVASSYLVSALPAP